MARFGEIEIPDELIDAQRENKLVIFAGAGVSYARPTNFYSFKKALQLTWDAFAGKDYHQFAELEQQSVNIPDRFEHLEKLHGPAIRQFVLQLYMEDRKPSVLHHLIIRLFTSAQIVKIVTTNYDCLISRESESFMGFSAKEYIYPNFQLQSSNPLPKDGDIVKLSDDGDAQFEGIAYLHGSIETDSKNIVLTTSNFRDAWSSLHAPSRNFLGNLLKNEFVLFIGYSLDDPVVKDVVGACADRLRTFAICPFAKSDNWDGANVHALTYQTSGDAQDKYEAIVTSLHKWAEQTQDVAIDLEQIYEITN